MSKPDIIRVTPGDRVSIGSTLIIVSERPQDWPRDWQHGVTESPDTVCIPAGERCGPHRSSWPTGERCRVAAVWDEEQA